MTLDLVGNSITVLVGWVGVCVCVCVCACACGVWSHTAQLRSCSATPPAGGCASLPPHTVDTSSSSYASFSACTAVLSVVLSAQSLAEQGSLCGLDE